MISYMIFLKKINSEIEITQSLLQKEQQKQRYFKKKNIKRMNDRMIQMDHTKHSEAITGTDYIMINDSK